MKILLLLLGAWFVFHAGREAVSIIEDIENEVRKHDTEQ